MGEPTRTRDPVRRPGRFFAGVLVLALAAAAFELAASAIRARQIESVVGASWIWAPESLDASEPVAFFAVADFEVDEAGAAQLAITADETYTVHLNGIRVGSGAYRDGAPLDLYDVGADLDGGWNRLVVELTSSSGVGGFLASLRVDGREVVVTGEGWRVVRRPEAGLFRGWPLTAGEPAQVWQRHPTGRWSVAQGVARPVAPIDVPVRRALRLRPIWEGSRWLELDRLNRRFSVHGSRLYFDWGEVVTGYLELDLETDDAGILYVGTELPAEAPEADALIVPIPGRHSWVDVHPRTFRYVLLVGAPLRIAPAVRLVAPEIVGQLAPPAPRLGVFGLASPRPDSPAEEDVRRRLSSL